MVLPDDEGKAGFNTVSTRRGLARMGFGRSLGNHESDRSSAIDFKAMSVLKQVMNIKFCSSVELAVVRLPKRSSSNVSGLQNPNRFSVISCIAARSTYTFART